MSLLNAQRRSAVIRDRFYHHNRLAIITFHSSKILCSIAVNISLNLHHIHLLYQEPLHCLFYLATTEDTNSSCISCADRSFSTRMLHNWHCLDSCTNETALKGKLLLIYSSIWNLCLSTIVSTVFYRLSELLRCDCRQEMDP